MFKRINNITSHGMRYLVYFAKLFKHEQNKSGFRRKGTYANLAFG
jgi:hypothetical protein